MRKILYQKHVERWTIGTDLVEPQTPAIPFMKPKSLSGNWAEDPKGFRSSGLAVGLYRQSPGENP